MQIRLHGTPAETAAALAAIAQVLYIQHVSRPYPDRRPPLFQRVYLDAEPHGSVAQSNRDHFGRLPVTLVPRYDMEPFVERTREYW